MPHQTITWNYGRLGLLLKIGNISPLTLATLSLSAQNASFSDNDLKSYSKLVVDQLSSVLGFNDKIKAKNHIDDSPLFRPNDFVDCDKKYLYKYVSESSAEFYKRGEFQVSSLGFFQKMENEKARDELEGLSFISTQMGNNTASTAVMMGSNYYVFCGTDQENDFLSDYHLANFGSVLLKIDIFPFVQKLAAHLGAVSYKIQKVKYANAKLIQTHLPLLMTTELFSNLSSNKMQHYLGHLIQECTVPSLFIKPGWFKDEIETRIVFEMSNDVNPNTPFRFKNTGLLDHVQFLY